MDANSLSTNIIVMGLVAALVVILPWADRTICRRLRLNLHGGVSRNPNADRLMRGRQMILFAGFAVYLMIVAYLVFFSRAATNEYLVHVAPLEDLKNAFSTPRGFSHWFQTLFSEGVTTAFSQISIARPEDISQFMMNVMFFVPMGYLLPYVFRWQRARVKIRPVLTCFLISFVIENIQLISRRGFYDMDDVLANTLGGWIGQMLYLSVGYVVTHPRWRREMDQYRNWKRNARHRTLYPFGKRIGLSRTTLKGTDEESVWDFYVTKLGFRPRRKLVPLDGIGTDFLLEMGRSQLEIHCSNRPERLEEQHLTISARRLPAIRKRLKMNGIAVGPYEQDPYTGLRKLEFMGPDNVCITVIEDS